MAGAERVEHPLKTSAHHEVMDWVDCRLAGRLARAGVWRCAWASENGCGRLRGITAAIIRLAATSVCRYHIRAVRHRLCWWIYGPGRLGRLVATKRFLRAWHTKRVHQGKPVTDFMDRRVALRRTTRSCVSTTMQRREFGQHTDSGDQSHEAHQAEVDVIATRECVWVEQDAIKASRIRVWECGRPAYTLHSQMLG